MDYTQLAADELIDRAYSARDEFNTLYESNDISDSTLDRMATLVDELESLQTEADSRVALAVLREKRDQLAFKVKKKTLLLPGGLNQRTPSTIPSGPGTIAVGFAEDDDSKKGAGVDLSEEKAALRARVEELAGKIPPAFLKNIEKVKAKAAAAKGEKDTKVEANVTPAVSPENAETKEVEDKASSSKPSLAVNKDVAPIEHIPTEGFPIGDPKHKGAKVIKAGSVKGLKVPKPVTYSDDDPLAFEEATVK